MKTSVPKHKGRLLILTLTDDVHVPFVTRHLHIDHVIVDPAQLLKGRSLSFSHDGKHITVTYDNQSITGITSVWYRHPYIPERDDIPVPAAYKDYTYSSIRRHILNLYSLFSDAYWLSDYYTLMRAESKPWQLQLASQLGFAVPKTLFTSDTAAANRFLQTAGDTVAKSMANTLPIIDNRVQHFYTTKIPTGTYVNLKNLHLAPSIFQQAIDVKLGLRVTVVGDQVFTAAVQDKTHTDHPDILDWRRAYTDGATHFETYDLPRPLQAKCIALTKALGLDFGAIDIMLDTKGIYWFLEINPNGQWAFIEEDTGQSIGKALAALLEHGGQK